MPTGFLWLDRCKALERKRSPASRRPPNMLRSCSSSSAPSRVSCLALRASTSWSAYFWVSGESCEWSIDWLIGTVSAELHGGCAYTSCPACSSLRGASQGPQGGDTCMLGTVDHGRPDPGNPNPKPVSSAVPPMQYPICRVVVLPQDLFSFLAACLTRILSSTRFPIISKLLQTISVTAYRLVAVSIHLIQGPLWNLEQLLPTHPRRGSGHFYPKM